MFENRPLIEYLPNVLRDVREYQALMIGEEPELAFLWDGIKNALDDQFVTSATENGVERWEAILNIVPQATLTLEERKFAILTRLAEQLPFTFRKLEQILTELCGPDGFVVNLNADEYSLHVQIELTAASNFNDLGMMLNRICPANLIITMSIRYNQHFNLKPFTHAQLNVRTHHQIRNEVLSWNIRQI